MGSSIGAQKSAAKRLGLTVEEYLDKLGRGLLHCWRCREWQPADEFALDKSRGSGREKSCRRSVNASRVRPRKPRPKLALRVVEARDGDGRQARGRVRYLVTVNIIPDANDLPCTDCGHTCGIGERIHEYDHYLGYAPEHHEDVEAVCVPCHHAREAARGTWSKVSAAAPQAVEAKS